MNSSAESRIIHLHVPKTAGTALRSAFEKASQGNFRAFPHWDESKYVNFSADDYDFFSGHISFKTASRIGGNIITVLRSPVDRFLSVYYFWRQLAEKGIERSSKTLMASKYSLAEFVKIKDEPVLLETLFNRMTWQLAHGNSMEHRKELKAKGLGENEVFALALENMASFAVVGIQERMDEFSRNVRCKFSVPLDVRKTNVTKTRAAVADVDVAVIRAIHEWLYMDLELYHQAAQIAAQGGEQ